MCKVVLTNYLKWLWCELLSPVFNCVAVWFNSLNGITYRRTLAAITGIIVTGGTVAYLRSRHQSRSIRPDSSTTIASGNAKETLNQNGVDDNSNRKSSQKRSRLRSFNSLAVILLSQMGRKGMHNLMALVATTVSCHLFLLFIMYDVVLHIPSISFRHIWCSFVYCPGHYVPIVIQLC